MKPSSLTDYIRIAAVRSGDPEASLLSYSMLLEIAIPNYMMCSRRCTENLAELGEPGPAYVAEKWATQADLEAWGRRVAAGRFTVQDRMYDAQARVRMLQRAQFEMGLDCSSSHLRMAYAKEGIAERDALIEMGFQEREAERRALERYSARMDWLGPFLPQDDAPVGEDE